MWVSLDEFSGSFWLRFMMLPFYFLHHAGRRTLRSQHGLMAMADSCEVSSVAPSICLHLFWCHSTSLFSLILCSTVTVLFLISTLFFVTFIVSKTRAKILLLFDFQNTFTSHFIFTIIWSNRAVPLEAVLNVSKHLCGKWDFQKLSFLQSSSYWQK